MKIRITWSVVYLTLATCSAHAAMLTNGDFETGDFTGYSRSGFLDLQPPAGNPSYATFLAGQAAGSSIADSNAVVMSQTSTFDGNGVAGPPVLPTQGNFLAFLSNETSAGDFSMTGSSISQTFTIPAGTSTFSADIALLNDTAPADFSTLDDFGGIALLQGTTVISQYNIDLAGSPGANQSVAPGANRGGFLNSTAFITVNFDVTAIAGQDVTFTGYVIQGGNDNFGESRLLLDNLRLSPATITVPEPGSSMAWIALAVMLIVLRFRQKTTSL